MEKAKKRLRGGKHKQHLPPFSGQGLLSTKSLKARSLETYKSLYKKMVAEPAAFEMIVCMRNSGSLSNEIVEAMLHSFGNSSNFSKRWAIYNSITVGKRYDLVVLTKGQYILTEEFYKIRRRAV